MEVHFSVVENRSSDFQWWKTGVLIIFIVQPFWTCKTQLDVLLTEGALTACIWMQRDMMR